MEEEEEEEIAWHRANVWQSLTVLWNCFSSRYRLPVESGLSGFEEMDFDLFG